MIDEMKIKEEAIAYYKEWVEGEPLTQEVPIDCFEQGAQFIIKKNKKNYKKALKSLEPIQRTMIAAGFQKEWMKIVNSLRLCAGMPLIKIK